MYPEKRLELVHFQLTRNCNLRCSFCGQWGRKGFFSNAAGVDMELDEWKRVVDSLVEYRKTTGINPSVMLWGGEPLVFLHFREISEYIRMNGFELGLITNGVFIDKYVDILKQDFKKIYISVDGPQEIHDKIRGRGVFERVRNNVQLLKGGNAEIVIMTVLTEELLKNIDNIPDAFEQFAPSKVLLQDLIFMSESEITDYAAWLKKNFKKTAKDIYAWRSTSPENYEKLKQAAFKKLDAVPCCYEFIHMKHGEKAAQKLCLSPFRHIHIAWNGNVLYCTDYYDFSAGNVREDGVIDIFNNELSEKFRHEIFNGNCAACHHCSWKNNMSFCL